MEVPPGWSWGLVVDQGCNCLCCLFPRFFGWRCMAMKHHWRVYHCLGVLRRVVHPSMQSCRWLNWFVCLTWCCVRHVGWFQVKVFQHDALLSLRTWECKYCKCHMSYNCEYYALYTASERRCMGLLNLLHLPSCCQVWHFASSILGNWDSDPWQSPRKWIYRGTILLGCSVPIQSGLRRACIRTIECLALLTWCMWLPIVHTAVIRDPIPVAVADLQQRVTDAAQNAQRFQSILIILPPSIVTGLACDSPFFCSHFQLIFWTLG